MLEVTQEGSLAGRNYMTGTSISAGNCVYSDVYLGRYLLAHGTQRHTGNGITGTNGRLR